MRMLIDEFKSALRGIAARPGFSALIVTVLGTGLACVIFMFVLVDVFVLRPLPFPEPQQLSQVGLGSAQGDADDIDDLAGQDLIALRRQLGESAQVAGFSTATTNISDLDRPERLEGAGVTANFWRVLGVTPQLGRDFNDDDERPGATLVVAISDRLWRQRYGADPAIIGRSLRINSQPATVVAVMPRDFAYPYTQTIWNVEAPTGADAAFTTVVRRAANIGDGAIASNVERWFADASAHEPDRFHALAVRVRPLEWFTTSRITRGVLNVMLGAVLLVLLIACANCANLLLGNTLARRHEIAVRVALGAGRSRLVAHLLAQSLLLTGISLLLAVPLAMAAAAWQQASFRAAESGPPLWMRFDIDGTVVAIACGVALLTALLAGLLPALRAARAAPSDALRDGSRSVGGGAFARISRVLVIGEIALSCLLMVGVGTLVGGIRSLDRLDLGIDTQHLLTARIALFPSAYPTGADQIRLFERLLDRLREDPDVVAASVGTALPARFSAPRELLPAGAAAEGDSAPHVQYSAVEDGFAAAYGVPLLRGRFFDSHDLADGERVAVVDQRFADRYANGGDVLGRRFRLDPRKPDAPTVTIVGVIGKLTLNGPATAPEPTLLVPLRQEPARIVSIAVRTRDDANAFAPRLSAIMREVDADTPLYWVRDYATIIRSITYGERIVTRWFGIFGFIALLLAGTGLYGVMAFNVSQRIREIGVRRALGAPNAGVLRDLFSRSLVQLGIGVALGIALGLPFAQLMTNWLSAIHPDPALALSTTLAVLFVAVALATALPARRALRVDPMVALRHD